MHVASKDVGALTAGLVTLLDSPACVRSVVLHDKIAQLLLVMLGPQASAGGQWQSSGETTWGCDLSCVLEL